MSKIDKYIEIVTIQGKSDFTIDRKNVGIELNKKLFYNILSKHYKKVCVTVIKTKEDLKNLINNKPDLVFSGIKYFNFNEQKIWLSDYLDEYNINYITSNKKALNKEYNKKNAKDIIEKANINTAKNFTTQPNEHPTENSIPLSFPLFLKPIIGGDSIGIDKESVVFDFKKFQEKVLDIYNNQQSRTLVESYLSGKEYSVSIFENIAKNILMIMPIEIIVAKNENGHRILDYDIKKNDLEEVLLVTDKKIYKEISDLAIKSFRALGGKIMGRIDIKMSGKSTPNFIEANFMPGLGKGYFYRSFMLNKNINYEEMILKIVDAGLSFK